MARKNRSQVVCRGLVGESMSREYLSGGAVRITQQCEQQVLIPEVLVVLRHGFRQGDFNYRSLPRCIRKHDLAKPWSAASGQGSLEVVTQPSQRDACVMQGGHSGVLPLAEEAQSNMTTGEIRVPVSGGDTARDRERDIRPTSERPTDCLRHC